MSTGKRRKTGTAGGDMAKTAGMVNRHLAKSLRGSPDGLYEASRHLIASGGKRLRPYMAIKSCQMLGGAAKDALGAASAVEMVHNFTLVHDDIMDNDEMRHGVPTVHKRFGTPVAILAGDILFSKAYQEIARAAPGRGEGQTREAISRLASACVEVCEGQMMDIKMAESDQIPAKSQYIAMIKKKTAALFDVSCAIGAICAGAGDDDVSRLSRFGLNLGIAFQITDDLMGAMGDPDITKKPVGNDIREGKKSLPILMALEASRGTPHHKAISAAFGNRRVSRAGLERAVSSVRELGIEEDVRRMACRYASSADKTISSYSGSAKEELKSLLEFVVKRSV